MSGINPTSDDLPSYIKNGDYFSQENYHELLNTILREWFNSSGFFLPTLTDTQVTDLISLLSAPYPIKIWYNSDQDKLQFLTPSGVVQTITST